MLPLVPPTIFNAFTYGFTWFIICFSIFIIGLTLACKYGSKQKEECACYNRSASNCAFCVTDKIMIALILIILAMTMLHLIRLNERINNVAIDGAKMDSFILKELYKNLPAKK